MTTTTKALYIARSTNRKTGDMPQVFIGATRDESKYSCRRCSLLDTVCYAQRGTPAFGHASAIRAHERTPERHTLKYALANRARGARAVRFGAIGDPSAMSRREYRRAVRLIQRTGLTIRSYTHFWRTRGSWLRGLALASCETTDQVLDAVALGWRATQIVEKFTPARLKFWRMRGLTVARCPAQLTANQVTCNDCRLCDPTLPRGVDVVLFERH